MTYTINPRVRKYFARSALETIEGLVLDALIELNRPCGVAEITKQLDLYNDAPPERYGWIVTECLYRLESKDEVKHLKKEKKWSVRLVDDNGYST